MNNSTKTSPLILIGPASKYFDADLQPTAPTELKCIVVKELKSDEIQILLLKMYEPFEYHAEALLSYMKEKHLSEIMINGGGKVYFDPIEKTVRYYDKSYAFGYVCQDEVLNFSKHVWSDFDIKPNFGSSSQSNMAVSGRSYSYEKVKYEAEHP